MTWFQAFLIGCYYWFAWWDFGMVGNITTNCTFIGFIFGLAFGDVKTGIILGATINAMYLTTVAAGGNLPSDPALSCCVAIPIALVSGLDAKTAVAFAVPFALLGTFMDNARRVLNSFWNRPARKFARELNFKGIYGTTIFGPIAVQFFVRVPIVTFIVGMIGTNAKSILNVLPPWLMTACSTIGGVLPGIGMILCATMIGRNSLVPFFIMGFFLFKVSGLSVLVITIFAVCIAITYVQLAFPKKSVSDDDDEEEDTQPKVAEYNGVLSKQMRFRTAMRVLFLHRFANNMETLFGPSLCAALTPALRDIYKDDAEGLKEALVRHMQPYISEMTWGNCIMGAVLAMEEQKVAGNPIAGEDISAVKTGLMGPFAGFGDSFNWATVAPLIRGVFLPFGLSGSFVGVLMEPVVRLYAVILGYITFEMGYKQGRNSLTNMLKGGWLEKFMTGAGVLGMFMLGALGAQYTTLSTPIKITLATGVVKLQDKLNAILPGLLPFAVLMGAYIYLRKGGKYLNLLLFVLVASIVTALLGIF